MKRCSSILFLFFIQNFLFSINGFAQDSLLTSEDAVKYAIENNYQVTISKNNIEIGKINNNWANAGAVPVVSATANKAVGINNLQQKLSNGTVTNKNGTTTNNFNAGVAVNWRIFDGLKMFSTKRRL